MSKLKTVSTLGLDIGSYSVKCVEFTRVKEKPKDKFILNQASLLMLGSQPPDDLTVILKPLTERILKVKDHVRIVMSGSSLLVRCIQLPIMTQAELEGAIRFEAENHIAFPIDDCILDFQIVKQNAEKKIMNVLLVAAKRDYVQEKLRMLMNLDIHPEILDVDTFSLVNAFEILGGSEGSDPEEKTQALLNIGHRVTSLAILHDHRPLFVREIPMGAAAITKIVAEAKGIPETEANVLKEETRPELLEEIKGFTQKGLEPLTEEVKRSLEYFENEIQSAIPTVYVSGGGSLGPGAAEAIAAGLGKKTTAWDGKRIETAPGADCGVFKDNPALFNIALGLALR